MKHSGFSIIVILSSLIIGCSYEDSDSSLTKKISPAGISENDTIEISGNLICTHCYALNEKNSGLNHQLPENGYIENCAVKCAQQNYPIGVLLDKENYGANVWVIRTSGQLFADYMTKSVKVKGLFITKGLIEPTSIKVQDKETWITLL